MVATQTLVEAVGPYPIDDETEFTKDVFTALSASAKVLLDNDNPGLISTLYDMAHAYMILHLFEVKLGSAGMKSESIGDYSYSRDVAGKTNWLMAYEQILGKQTAKSMLSGDSLDGVARADAIFNDAKMDQSELLDVDED